MNNAPHFNLERVLSEIQDRIETHTRWCRNVQRKLEALLHLPSFSSDNTIEIISSYQQAAECLTCLTNDYIDVANAQRAAINIHNTALYAYVRAFGGEVIAPPGVIQDGKKLDLSISITPRDDNTIRISVQICTGEDNDDGQNNRGISEDGSLDNEPF